MRLLLHLLLPLLASSSLGPFSGHQLLRTQPSSLQQTQTLLTLGAQIGIDFWNEPGPGRSLDLRVAPHQAAAVTSLLLEQNISSQVLQSDLQPLVEKDWVVPANSSYSTLKGHSMDWTSYHSLEDIEGYMDHLAATYSHVELETIGQSYEGHDMRVLKICRGGCGGKPAIWVDGGIHAREWVSPAVTAYLAWELVEQEDGHPDITSKMDWYILPVLNPDGFQWSMVDLTTRMWRKTRSMDPDGLGLCLGADANRNWGFHFGSGGSSDDPCLDIFMGADAFSEVENRNVRDFLAAHSTDVKMYNSLHSYSQLVLLPWGWTEEQPDNYGDLLNLANIGNAALKAVHGSDYTVGCIPCLLYPASGGSLDWTLGVAGIPYSMAMELRDTGSSGFFLPADQILPTGEEVWAFHMAVAEQIIQEFPPQD